MKTKLLVFPLIFILTLINVSALGATILPVNPIDNDNLLCVVPGAMVHQDSIYQWRRNGIVQNDVRIYTDAQGSHYPKELTSSGDQISCLVYSLGTLVGVDTITIRPNPTNALPIANAGPDRVTNVNVVERFDASNSRDPDGRIVSYQWNFGDSTTGEGVIVTHAYSSIGIFTVTLTVTDNNGARATDTALVRVTQPGSQPSNIAINNLNIYKDKFQTESSDFYRGSKVYTSFTLLDIATNRPVTGKSNEVIVALRNTQSASYIYLMPFSGEITTSAGILKIINGEAYRVIFGSTVPINDGTYYFVGEVPLSDNFLGASTINIGIANTGASLNLITLNNQPVADAGPDVTVRVGHQVIFDGSNSRDLEDSNTILRYTWDFGDFTSQVSGKTVRHAYASPGIYFVGLRVVDSDGATHVDTARISVNRLTGPEANFRVSNNIFILDNVVFDASLSQDRDGRIVSYQWNFGDSITGEGKVVNHVYNEPGSYPVSLTVIDDDGNKDTTFKIITVQEYNQDLTSEDRLGMTLRTGIDHDKQGSNARLREVDYRSFAVTGILPMNYKAAYKPGDSIDLLIKLKNDGNMNENLNMKIGVLNLGISFQARNMRVNPSSSLLKQVALVIPQNVRKGIYLTKIEVDNRKGDRTEAYWQFIVA